MRLLELWLKRNGIAHDGAVATLLRFQNSLSLNFPASQIEAVAPQADVAIGTAAVAASSPASANSSRSG